MKSLKDQSGFFYRKRMFLFFSILDIVQLWNKSVYKLNSSCSLRNSYSCFVKQSNHQNECLKSLHELMFLNWRRKQEGCSVSHFSSLIGT